MVLFRNILGTKNLSEILSDRESIADAMHHSLEVATDPWGVHVERNRHVMSSYNIVPYIYLLILSHAMTSPGGCRVEIKDVRLPQQLQRAMAAEAEATREARAKVTRMIMMMMVNGYDDDNDDDDD